jgi:hypothetical protein
VNYNDSYGGGNRVSLSSLLLLVIFVSAAALIVAAAIWRPWSGSSDAVVAAPTVTVPAGQAVSAGGTPVADPNAPQGP